MVEENRRTKLLPFPVCEVHGLNDAALNGLAIRPHRTTSVVVQPMSHEFIVALRALRQERASAMNSQLANVNAGDPRDFLKSLERE
jgi:hypothetical protein